MNSPTPDHQDKPFNLRAVQRRIILGILTMALLLPLFMTPSHLYAQAVITDPLKNDSTTNDSTANENTVNESTTDQDLYYPVAHLNVGLPSQPDEVNLQTPQAAMEELILGVRAGDADAAAHALNLNLLPLSMQIGAAPTLATQLVYILEEQYLIDWDQLPDRPDGQLDSATTPADESFVGKPRRSILLSTLPAGGRDIEARLQRVKVGDTEPVWVVSSNTVENIGLLYETYGPSPLDSMMPAWARATLWSQTKIWEWLAFLLLFLLAGAAGWGIWRVSRRILCNSNKAWARELSTELPIPLSLAAAALIFYIPLQTYLSLTGPLLSLVKPGFYALLIIALLWIVLRAISLLTRYFAPCTPMP